MEDISLYGAAGYRTCPSCSWTDKIENYEVVPALPGTIDIVRCPYCGDISSSAIGSFNPVETNLPDGFKIISGGQTGVDRAALDAAIQLGIPHGGWCPKGRKAEDGRIDHRYNLQETLEADYRKRTEKNIIESDGTLVLPGEAMSKGTALTINLARKHSKPTAVIPLISEQDDKSLMAWVKSTGIKILNVAGPRESIYPGIGLKAMNFLLKNLGSQHLQSASLTSTRFR
jgi:hypothetical protein